MSTVEKQQLSDVEAAKVQGGKTVTIYGEEYDLFEEPNVTIYCPKCDGTVFGCESFFGVKRLTCVKCGYDFWKDVEGAASVGGDW